MSSFDADVSALFAALSSLAHDGTCRATVETVLDMREQIVELKSARKLHTRELHEASIKLDHAENKLAEQDNELAALQNALQTSNSELARLQEQFKKEKAESEEAFSVVTAQLDAKIQRVEELEGFTSNLNTATLSSV